MTCKHEAWSCTNKQSEHTYQLHTGTLSIRESFSLVTIMPGHALSNIVIKINQWCCSLCTSAMFSGLLRPSVWGGRLLITTLLISFFLFFLLKPFNWASRIPGDTWARQQSNDFSGTIKRQVWWLVKTLPFSIIPIQIPIKVGKLLNRTNSQNQEDISFLEA